MMDSAYEMTATDELLINGLVAFLRLSKFEPVRGGVKSRRIMDTLDALSPHGLAWAENEIEFLRGL